MRKLRTRRHVIEDLSYNFVEKQVLLAFCTFERYRQQQYSYDGHIFTFNEKGETEGGLLYVQVKATDKLVFSEKNKGYELALDKRDMELWINEKLPVLIVLYDAKEDKGYFLNLGKYFEENRLLLKDIHKFMRVFIPVENLFLPDAINKQRIIKNESYANY